MSTFKIIDDGFTGFSILIFDYCQIKIHSYSNGFDIKNFKIIRLPIAGK